MIRIALVTLVVALLGGIVGLVAINPLHLSGLSKKEDPSEPAGPRVAAVALGSMEAPLVVSRYRGDVRARRETQLAFRRSGRVIELNVDSGDSVQAGDCLGRLDVSDLDAQQRIAIAQVRAAEAELAEAVAGPRRQTLEAAAAEVRSIESQLESAETRLKREQSLADRGAGIAQTFDDVKFDVERLTASLQRSMAILEELNEGTRAEQIAAAEARLELAKASLARIEVDRADSQILAPYDSIVSARMLDEGTIVGPNQTVIGIIESSPLEAHFGLPSGVAAALQVGQSVTLIVGHRDQEPNLDGNTLELKSVQVPHDGIMGKIVRMAPQVDPVTRTRGIEVEFQSPLGSSASAWIGETATLLLPDLFESLNSEDSLSTASFWVPSGALVRGVRGLWSMYVITDDSMTQRRDVRVAKTIGDWSLIVGEVDSKTLIVVQGTQRVGPGMHVVVERQDMDDRVLTSDQRDRR